MAALGGMDACVNEMNSQCVNSEGSFDCVCAPGYAMISGSCERSKLQSICMSSTIRQACMSINLCTT